MAKRIVIILLAAVVLGGCNLVPQKSGIEIMSYPTAKVYINGKEAGMTPYKNTSLTPGKLEVRLVGADREWSRAVELRNNINTVIDWEIGKSEKSSGGYILFLEKTGDTNKAGLLINAVPNKCAVAVDGEIKGYSPIKLDDVGEGDRQITISYPGYKGVNVYVKAIKGYQLIVESKLAREEVAGEYVPVDSEKIVSELEAGSEKVKIKETETGWLRVRSAASNNASEVARVNPGEDYDLIEEEGEWYKISLKNGTEGWISAKYAEKF